MKYIFILIFLISSSVFANITVSISNPMMNGINNIGDISIGPIDPFNPQATCNSFIAPNTCSVLSRDAMRVNLNFNYLILTSSNTVSLSFDVVNPVNSNSFLNISIPSDLLYLNNNSSGNFNLGFDIPLFGPDSYASYDLTLLVDVVLDP